MHIILCQECLSAAALSLFTCWQAWVCEHTTHFLLKSILYGTNVKRSRELFSSFMWIWISAHIFELGNIHYSCFKVQNNRSGWNTHDCFFKVRGKRKVKTRKKQVLASKSWHVKKQLRLMLNMFMFSFDPVRYPPTLIYRGSFTYLLVKQ